MARSLEERAMDLRRRDLGGWTSEQLVRLLIANAAGLALIMAGTFQTNRAEETQDALTWLAVGLFGLVVAMVGDATWVFRGRERTTFARVALISGPDAIEAIVAPLISSRQLTVVDALTEGTGLGAAPGMTHYHESACPFLGGRNTTFASREQHEAAGLRPCEVCQP